MSDRRKRARFGYERKAQKKKRGSTAERENTWEKDASASVEAAK